MPSQSLPPATRPSGRLPRPRAASKWFAASDHFGEQLARKVAVLLAVLAIPVALALVYSSHRTFRSLEEQKSVYLRSRVAAIAARLETTTPPAVGRLLEDEPGLVNLIVMHRGDPSVEARSLAAIWEGRELFRTTRSDRLFRSYVPFHAADGLRIARIDMDANAAEFLVEHAKHNIVIASIAVLLLLLLTIAGAWNARRLIALEHLAEIGKMSAVLAHEIRNPLGTIKGFTQLLDERTNGESRALVSPILCEISRLEMLVTDLLLYGRPPHPHLTSTSWRELQNRVEAHATHAIGDRSIRFATSARDMRFDTDPAMLEQALLNVIRNAVEAVPDGEPGEVKLDIDDSGCSGLRIAVRDTGPGLSAEARRHLYEPFFTTKAQGTGLGFAITRRLVESLGGRVTVCSNVPRGTTVEFCFPKLS